MNEVFRTLEIEEATNRYIVHPASNYLVRHFARWGLSPNTVSMLGMVSAAIAAWCLYYYHHLQLVLLGFVLLVGWHVFDGADGQLARLTGKTSHLGKIIDGLCDHLGVAMVYVSLSLVLAAELGAWVWLITVAAGLCHAVQASAFEYQRDMYDCWVHDKQGKCVPSLDELSAKSDMSSWAERLHLGYVGLQHRFAAVDERLADLRRHGWHDSGARTALAAAYRRINQPSVMQWAWLSANKRTMAIGVTCAAQAPLVYFAVELTLLNGLLWWLMRQQHRRNAQFFSEAQAILGGQQPGPAPIGAGNGQ